MFLCADGVRPHSRGSNKRKQIKINKDHKQQDQPKALKLQKEIENMPKEYKPLSKCNKYQWPISVSLHAPTVRNC
jgi:hypothetical protein